MASTDGSPSKIPGDDEELPLAKYEVLSASADVPVEVKYTVQKRGRRDGPLLWWRGRRWPGPEPARLATLRREARRLSALSSSTPRLLRLHHILFHSPSDTLYIVTDHISSPALSLRIDHCKNKGETFRENFIWNFLYQAALACEKLQNLLSTSWLVQFDDRRIYVDDACNIVFDPFLPITDDFKRDSASCPTYLCQIGKIIYEMCTLTKYSENNYNLFNCSKDLENIVEKLLHKTESAGNCQITYNILLYHPTVLSHLDKVTNIFEKKSGHSEIPASMNDSAFESDESIKINLSSLKIPSNNVSHETDKSDETNSDSSKTITELDFSPTLMALDLKLPGYVPRRPTNNVNKLKSYLDLCKEPEEVSQYALSKVWLDRLETLQKREEALKAKEKEITKQEIFNEVRAKILNDTAMTDQNSSIAPSSIPGITIKTAMADKILNGEDRNESECFPELKQIELNCLQNPRIHRANLPSLQKRPPRKSRSKPRKRTTMNYEDMDSSLSADPGDNSFYPTSCKMSADIVSRPSILSNNLRRKVHFNNRNNPFAEYDSVSSTTFTFFDIENVDSSYEAPIVLPEKSESVAERISKFAYFDLEDITNKKRELMEELRKSPIKSKPVLKSNSNSQMNATFAVKSPRNRLNRKTKYSSPRLVSSSHLNIYNCANSESSGMSTTSYPCAGRIKDRRKSMPLIMNSKKTNQPNIDTDQSMNKSSLPENEIMTRSKSIRKSCRNVIFNNRLSLAFNKKTASDEPIPVSKKVNDKENFKTPSVNKIKDSKRKSILGFKTPFKLNL